MKISKNEKFLCFGADGGPHIRYLKEVHLDSPYAPDLILENREDPQAITYAPFDITEVVPLNKEARVIVAKLLWKKNEVEFKTWRNCFNFKFPSLKGYYSNISKVIE